MTTLLINTAVSLLFFGLMDAFWFSVFMKKYSNKMLKDFLHIKEEKIYVKMSSALIVYILMVLIAVFFLAPLVNTLTNQFIVFLYGALMGACVFGVYDFTNHATVKDYPITFALVDTSWGAFMYGCLALILKNISSL